MYASGHVDGLSVGSHEMMHVLRSRSDDQLLLTTLRATASGRPSSVLLYLRAFDALDSVTTVNSPTTTLVPIPPARVISSIQNYMDYAVISSTEHSFQSAAMISDVLGRVECILAPNCTALNRKSCKTTPNTCGSCTSPDYVGQEGDSNSKCILYSDPYLRQQSTCTTDDNCSPLDYCSSEVCVPRQKQCSFDCSGHGSCYAFDTISGNKVHSCLSTDITCFPKCICSSGFDGQWCSLTSKDFTDKKALFSSIFKRISR